MPAPNNTDDFRRSQLLAWEGIPSADILTETTITKSEDSAAVTELRAEISRLQDWIDNLQKGCYVNCVYCGHRYGPDDSTPVSQAEILRRHVAGCTAHPMYRLKLENDRLRDMMLEVRDQLTETLKADL